MDILVHIIKCPSLQYGDCITGAIQKCLYSTDGWGFASLSQDLIPGDTQFDDVILPASLHPGSYENLLSSMTLNKSS